MTLQKSTLDRRTAITTAAIAGTTAFGALALVGSDSAAASSVSIDASDVAADSADGSIERVYVAPEATLWWQDFDEPIDGVSLLLESKIDGVTDWQTVIEGDHTLPGSDRGLAGETTIEPNGGDLTLYDGGDTAYFEASEDGSETTQTVTLRATTVLLSDGDRADPEAEAVLEAAASFDVAIENREAAAGGEVTIETGAET